MEENAFTEYKIEFECMLCKGKESVDYWDPAGSRRYPMFRIPLNKMRLIQINLETTARELKAYFSTNHYGKEI